MKKILFVSLIVVSCNTKNYKDPHIVIKTGYGDIEVELYPAKAPKTVTSFLSYIDAGYYNKTSFYRVLKADELPTDNNTGLIQGGTYRASKVISVPGIEHETTGRTGLTHTNGTISLARTLPGTATTEFFICIGDQSELDSARGGTTDSLGMAAFGKVVKGMKVVRKIQSQNSHGDAFDKAVEIRNITRL